MGEKSDNWIVAAAAGAGYIAQHWKDLMRGGQSISELSLESFNFVKPKSSPLLRQVHDKKGPVQRLLRRKNLGEDVSKDRELVPQGDLMTVVASTSGFDGENLVILGCHEDQEGIEVSGVTGERSNDLLLTPSSGKLGFSYCSPRTRSILRSKRTNGHFIKPVSSLESCLMAQLYKERAEIEEYMFRKIPSPSMPTVRPLIVTDGSRIISRSSGDSFSVQTRNGENRLQKKTYTEENKTVFGVPPLPNVGSMESRRKIKVNTGKERGGRLSRSSKMVRGKHPNSQGSSHGALLFCLGISIGIISSLLASNREVYKLNELLKQTENLVQDLQEELEMKDSLTVKELAVEDYESQDTNGDSYKNEEPHAFSREKNLDESTEQDTEFHDQKAEEESLSKIEAELEAELERLEVNMNSSSLEGKLSDLIELDPDFVPDIVHGELRASMFSRQTDAQPYADRDGSGTSTTHSINYAVSPRELSLRLHEVLQSRLEERVMELETALQNSQRKVQYTESEHMHPWREFSNNKSRASSIGESPFKEAQSFADQPMVINLSGEALDSYNEAYDEFLKINESEEEDLNSHQESLHPFDQNLCHSISNGNASVVHQKGENHNRNDNDTSEYENDNGDDEMEKLLIKQILEKTRKGSPVVFNAQMALFSMDENEN